MTVNNDIFAYDEHAGDVVLVNYLVKESNMLVQASAVIL